MTIHLHCQKCQREIRHRVDLGFSLPAVIDYHGWTRAQGGGLICDFCTTLKGLTLSDVSKLLSHDKNPGQ